jgi:hypothetical protein
MWLSELGFEKQCNDRVKKPLNAIVVATSLVPVSANVEGGQLARGWVPGETCRAAELPIHPLRGRSAGSRFWPERFQLQGSAAQSVQCAEIRTLCRERSLPEACTLLGASITKCSAAANEVWSSLFLAMLSSLRMALRNRSLRRVRASTQPLISVASPRRHQCRQRRARSRPLLNADSVPTAALTVSCDSGMR